MIHNWQPIERGFRCTGCGAWSAKGRSIGECTPTTEPIAITQAPAERPRQRINIGDCIYRGEPTGRKVDCGCPSLRDPIYRCELLGGECSQRGGDSRSETKNCRRCESFVTIVVQDS